MVNIENVITELMNFYSENCAEKPMEYAYGFFDALGVLCDMRKELRVK